MALETKIPGREATGTGHETLVAGLALFSAKPADLARFYEQVLRTAFTHRVHDDGREHWITSLGGVQLEIKAVVTAAGTPTADSFGSIDASGTSRSELSFQVGDVPAAAARALVAGGRMLQASEAFSWGTFAVVLDPDGNRLGLYTPVRGHDPNSDTEDHA